MAAPTDSSGTMKYWIDGLPFQGIQKSGNDAGTMKFWNDGLPGQDMFPQSGNSFVFIGRFF